MASQGVTTDGVLMAAPEAHGVGTLGDIEHAVLESGGGISIILRPATSPGSGRPTVDRHGDMRPNVLPGPLGTGATPPTRDVWHGR